MNMIEILKSEYKNRFSVSTFVLLHALLYYYRDPNFRAVVLTRYCVNGKSLRKRKRYSKKLSIKYGMVISLKAEIGKNFWIEHFNGVVIGRYSVIGDNCTVYQQVTIGQSGGHSPVIGKNVTIYAGAKVVGNIKVGDNVIIGANAVVVKDLPDNCTAAGVPAKIISQK